MLELVLELHQRSSEQFNALLASHEPLNRQSEERLFRAMELDEAPATAAQQPSSDDPLLRACSGSAPASLCLRQHQPPNGWTHASGCWTCWNAVICSAGRC